MENPEQRFTLAIWTVMKGKEKEFINTWETFAKSSIERMGTNWAYLSRDINEPRRFISFGLWDNVRLINEWREWNVFKEFIAKAASLCEEVVKPAIMEPVAHVEKVLVH